MFMNGETTEFAGISVVALANDPHVLRKTGRILLTADLATEYGFNDLDGRVIPSMRSVGYLLEAANFLTGLVPYLPAWLKLPGWFLTAVNSKL